MFKLYTRIFTLIFSFLTASCSFVSVASQAELTSTESADSLMHQLLTSQTGAASCVNALLAQTLQQQTATLRRLPYDAHRLIKDALIDRYRQLFAHVLSFRVRRFDYNQKNNTISAMTFSPNNQFALTGSQDGSSRVWDTTTGKCIVRVEDHPCRPITSVAISPNNRLALTAAHKTANLWDITTGTRIVQFSGDRTPGLLKRFSAPISAVLFSPDSRCALIMFIDRTAYLYEFDVATNSIIHAEYIDSAATHHENITATTINTTLSIALTGSDRGSACLWNTTTLSPIQQFHGHTSIITSVALSADGRFALTGSTDQTACLWDTATGASLKRLTLAEPQKIKSVTFSPDDKYAIIIGSENYTCLWNFASDEETEIPPTSSMVFSPNGRLALTAFPNNNLYLCTVAKLDELTLGQLLFIIKLYPTFQFQAPLNLNDPQVRHTLQDMAPVIDRLPQLPGHDYGHNGLIKAYIDFRRKQLLEAAEHNDVATVRALIKRGFTFRTCDKDGRNLWHYAFKGASKDVLEYLLKLDGNNNGLKKVSKLGLPAFAEGIINHTDFTRDFLNSHCIPQDSNSNGGATQEVHVNKNRFLDCCAIQ